MYTKNMSYKSEVLSPEVILGIEDWLAVRGIAKNYIRSISKIDGFIKVKLTEPKNIQIVEQLTEIQINATDHSQYTLVFTP